MTEERQDSAFRDWLWPWRDHSKLDTASVRKLALARTIWVLLPVLAGWLALPGGVESTMWPGLIMLIALPCLSLWRRRVGDARHCSACGYEVGPMRTRPRRCPECGANWNKPGGLTRGTVKKDRLLLWIGIGIFLLTVPWYVNLFLHTAPDLKWGRFPLSLLTPELRDPDGYVSDEAWTALTSRALTQEETARIIDALLDRRSAGGNLWGEQIAWLEATLPTLKGRADLTDRYYQEWLQLDLGVPKQVAADRPFAVTANPRPRFWSSSATAVQAWVTHIFIGDSNEPVLSPMVEFNASKMFPQGGQWFFIAPGSRSLERMPPLEWTIPAAATDPGPTEVRVEIVHIAGPPQFATVPGLTRSGDQMTVDPAATYVKTVELSVPIDVTE